MALLQGAAKNRGTESQNHLSWNGPLKVACNEQEHQHLDQAALSLVQPDHECLQRQGIHGLSAQPSSLTIITVKAFSLYPI